MIQPASIEAPTWAMLQAAKEGDLNTIRDMVAKDPDLVNCEYQYRKPLHFAVLDNRRDVVQFLLENGADPISSGLELPLTIARDRGYQHVAALLESHIKDKYQIVPEGNAIAEMIRNRSLEQLRPELIHAADERGNQPIHWAVMTRQMSLIDFLLERGADINAMRPDGARPLDLTNGDYWYRGWRDVPPNALRKHDVLIGYLIARGADYDISVAAKIGDLERVRALLDENPALVNKVPPYSTYYSGLPLRCAAAAGFRNIVMLLLERGANPNEPESIAPRGAALRDAIGGKHWEIVKLLLEHGADPNAMVDSSGNCMYAARTNGASAEILNLIASYGGVMGVEITCYEGDVALLGAMLHANPALSIDEGSLQYAIENGHRELVSLVLRYQPDILKMVVLPDVKTPEFARWLMDRGINPNRANWLGIGPLHRFAKAGDLEMAAVCVDFGADLNPIDEEYSSTPLGWAARSGRREMVAWLLDRGADPNLPADKPWALPIEWAKRRGHQEVAALL